ncbi:MAG: SET domain-containing protein-lysine N-methyltransferase [Chitinophagales bacterium]
MKKTDVQLKVKRGASGLGLFAMEPIAKGQRIIEYTGEKINEDEANRRGGMYLFELNSKWYIDGKDRKNTARYINHACKSAANCDIDIKAGRIWVFAKKNIKEGEELSYDYGKEMFDAYIKPYGCRCAKCSKK